MPGMSAERSILIVAGEASVEQHAAGLMEGVKCLFPNLTLHWFGAGGPRMGQQGAELLGDVSQLGAIGPWDALAHLGDYLALYRRLVHEAERRRPNLVVLVDFPEFNLRLARRLREQGVPTVYFISPQVWAWRMGRVNQIRKYVDLMMVIFPFEVDFYQRHGVNAVYVGNPTYSSLRHRLITTRRELDEPKRVALFPGSRNKEIKRLFPLLLDCARYVSNRAAVEFRVAKAPSVRRDQLECIYTSWTAKTGVKLPLTIGEEESAALLASCDCAIIKSGTSTLEAMVLEVPFAMVYRMARPSWYAVKPFARTNTYCLANLVAGTRIVPEFVQDQATAANIGGYILRLLTDRAEHSRIRECLRQAASRLGELDAYDEAARRVGALLLEGSTVR